MTIAVLWFDVGYAIAIAQLAYIVLVIPASAYVLVYGLIQITRSYDRKPRSRWRLPVAILQATIVIIGCCLAVGYGFWLAFDGGIFTVLAMLEGVLL